MVTSKALPTLIKVQIAVAAIAVAVTAWMGFSLPPLLKKAEEARAAISHLEAERDRALADLAKQQKIASDLREQTVLLEMDQAAVMSTIGEVINAANIEIIDPDIQFSDIETDFSKLAPGKRKQAVMVAILMAWKSIPFATGGTDVDRGLGSPEFLFFVLERVGIKIPRESNKLPSESLMRTLKKVEQPAIGDIAMYRGSSGFYGAFVVSLGEKSGGPIGLGGYNSTLPVQIRSLSRGNREAHPLIGYFHVPYEEAQKDPDTHRLNETE